MLIQTMSTLNRIRDSDNRVQVKTLFVHCKIGNFGLLLVHNKCELFARKTRIKMSLAVNISAVLNGFK